MPAETIAVGDVVRFDDGGPVTHVAGELGQVTGFVATAAGQVPVVKVQTGPYRGPSHAVSAQHLTVILPPSSGEKTPGTSEGNDEEQLSRAANRPPAETATEIAKSVNTLSQERDATATSLSVQAAHARLDDLHERLVRLENVLGRIPADLWEDFEALKDKFKQLEKAVASGK